MNSAISPIEAWRTKNNVDLSTSEKSVLDWRAQRLAIAALIPTVYEAGYVLSMPLNGDDDSGVDLTISGSETLGHRGGSVLDVQVKSVRDGSGSLRGNKEDGFTYDLDATTYNRLVRENILDFVFVLVVFEPDVDWIRESDEDIIQRCQRYMVHLLGREQTSNTKTQSIAISPSDRLDSVRLRKFIEAKPGRKINV